MLPGIREFSVRTFTPLSVILFVNRLFFRGGAGQEIGQTPAGSEFQEVDCARESAETNHVFNTKSLGTLAPSPPPADVGHIPNTGE